jgi:hypothetical protein
MAAAALAAAHAAARQPATTAAVPAWSGFKFLPRAICTRMLVAFTSK